MPEVVLLKCVNTRSVFKFVALSDHKLRFERPFGKQKTVDADFLKKAENFCFTSKRFRLLRIYSKYR